MGAPVRLLEGQLGLSGVLDGVHRVMGRRVDVLLQGESGTGEELVARILHEADPVRASARFVAVNCAALPEGVLEAELFGVCRGAYTGADADRPGLFRLAHGGTLFLDEVGDQPTTLQPKLLRALQERRVRSLGGTEETAVDVRVVSATHLDLALASAESRFRADL
ncbi:MAG: sigma-54 factor interaction domain-containing protein [Candidatus Latescibacteria bacterium]|nr:sigma-54 factor interaction domain-containing protein [Candidatus Latescibacterota bacterium]